MKRLLKVMPYYQALHYVPINQMILIMISQLRALKMSQKLSKVLDLCTQLHILKPSHMKRQEQLLKNSITIHMVCGILRQKLVAILHSKQ